MPETIQIGYNLGLGLAIAFVVVISIAIAVNAVIRLLVNKVADYYESKKKKAPEQEPTSTQSLKDFHDELVSDLSEDLHIGGICFESVKIITEMKPEMFAEEISALYESKDGSQARLTIGISQRSLTS